MSRKGIYRYAAPITLNSSGFYEAETDYFNIPEFNIVPEIVWWDLNSSDPIGHRHENTHEAFVAIVGSGRETIDEYLTRFNFNDVDIGSGVGISEPRCMNMRIASKECETARLTQMRLWVQDDSDFLGKNYRIVWDKDTEWLPNKRFHIKDAFPVSSEKNYLPTSDPGTQKIFAQDGGVSIHGSGDTACSEYIYLALAVSGNVIPGEYGAIPSSGFKLRMSYSFDNFYRE